MSESSNLDGTMHDDDTDKIALSPIEMKDKSSNENGHSSLLTASNAEIKESDQTLNLESVNVTELELDEIPVDAKHITTISLESNSIPIDNEEFVTIDTADLSVIVSDRDSNLCDSDSNDHKQMLISQVKNICPYNEKISSDNDDCLIPISVNLLDVIPLPANESKSNKTEQSKVDPHPTIDVYEKEKDDIIDTRWQHVKELSTNEERYQQVRSCWQSTTVPDPDRNLTFHSYRKKQFKNSQPCSIRQHKRQASSKLSGSEAKRSRSCTYLFDDKINSIATEKEKQSREIMKEMQNKINNIEAQNYHRKVSLQTNFIPCYAGYLNHASSFRNCLLLNLQQEHQRQVACIQNEYQRKAFQCDAEYQHGIASLNNVRNEVLQFYSFYKGLNKSTIHDPTILSDSQLEELDDIKMFYSQMDNYYK